MSFFFFTALIVRDLAVFSSMVGQLDVSWSPPDASQNNCAPSTYTVMYRLVKHVTCNSDDTTQSEFITQTTSSTFITLSGLSDYAEFEVRVRADHREVEGIEIEQRWSWIKEMFTDHFNILYCQNSSRGSK